MTVSFGRNLLAHIVKFVSYLLWFLDSATSVRSIYLVLLAVYGLMLFLIRSSDLKNIIGGVLESVNPSFFSTITYENIYPLKYKLQSEPNITSVSAGVYDVKTGKILYSRNIDERLAPASTTKLMTALVALDIYSENDTVKIPYFCTNLDSTKAGFPADEEFKAYDLIKSMLVGSLGDAACALATSRLSYSDFLTKMNEKALSLGMENTNFVNPIGLDGYKGVHYATVSDLHKLALLSIQKEVIREAVESQEYSIRSLSSDYTYRAFNTNRLLWEIPGTFGIKTGTTIGAGEVLIYGWGDSERELIIIVMGSKDRFTDTKSLLNWTLNNYVWK